ncbi:oxidoreductase [Phanerochaete sordida]|uniref:Oxidoreductase n=1 Tax=Phanerochaete sordida TaxID=48140 RepID=A0A9P3FXI1_9APHY|nr:oxidoreductase [Phanerochaete sordida]
MSGPIKTAVLGVGLSGLTFHVPFVLALPELFTLHAVLERSPAGPGGRLQARFGEAAARGVAIYNTLDQVLADPQVELVIIGTPSETHYEFAKRTLEAGKHVLVDKPVTATSAQAHELDALAKARGLVLYPYQNRRWDSDFLALQALLALPAGDARSLGTLWEFESRFDRFRTALKGTWKDEPRPANGLTYDLAAHTLDQALVLFGRPLSVTARVENIRGLGHPDVDDNFTITLRYPPRPAPAGALQPTSFTVILRGSILSVRAPQVRYVVRGTQGTYTKFGVDVQEDQLRVIGAPEEIFTAPAYGQEPEELFGTLENQRGDDVVRSIWPSSQKGDYAGLFRDVARAIREKAPQAVKFEQSAEVIEMIELALQSSKEGRTIPVPPRA